MPGILAARAVSRHPPVWIAEDRPLRGERHYPLGVSDRHPYRVWTARRALALNATCGKASMTRLTSLARLQAPLGGQEIELQQIDFDGGGMSLLRTRIREKSRFTVFDIDPVTARAWGQALLDWAVAQPGE
jgi:hypothetical protein